MTRGSAATPIDVACSSLEDRAVVAQILAQAVSGLPNYSRGRAQVLISLEISNPVSSGGAVNPPAIPAIMRGMRMSSRKRSQLSRESCTAMIVQPSAD